MSDEEYYEQTMHDTVPGVADGTADSESALNDLLSTASRHYTNLPPHVRARETSKLMMALIKQNKEMRKSINELLIWHSHSDHCININGHPAPGNDRCVCYIGRAKELIGR